MSVPPEGVLGVDVSSLLRRFRGLWVAFRNNDSVWFSCGTSFVDVPHAQHIHNSVWFLVEAAVKSSQAIWVECNRSDAACFGFRSFYLRAWLRELSSIVKWQSKYRIGGVRAWRECKSRGNSNVHTHTKSAVRVFSITYYWFNLFSFIVLWMYDFVLLLFLEIYARKGAHKIHNNSRQ